MSFEAVGFYERVRGSSRQAQLESVLHYTEMALQGTTVAL